MHVGNYDNEPVTIAVLDDFIKKSGYEAHIDLQQHFHHEIYLSDPRKTAQDKLKTVIRYPVKIALPPRSIEPVEISDINHRDPSESGCRASELRQSNRK